MLKKLLKHEFRATRRFFLPAYGIFVILLVLERLSILAAPLTEGEGFFATMSAITMGLITVLTVIGLFALLISPMVFNAIRFYRNMLGDEGYLTFTLPVSVDQLILSRLLTAMTWQILTGLVVGLFGGAFLFSLEPEAFAGLFEELSLVFGYALDSAGGWLGVIVLELLIMVLINIACQLLVMYSAMSIGQIANRHKLLASFGAYIGISTAVNWLLSISMTLFVFTLDNGWADNLLSQLELAVAGNDFTIVFIFYAAFCLIYILGASLLALGYYFLTRYFLTKKLNLA